MMASVHSVHRGPSPPGPTAIFSICCLSCCAGLKFLHEPAVDLHLANVVVGRHISAAVPAFVADAEKGDFVWSWMPVGGALLRQRRRLLRPSCTPAIRPLPEECRNRH